MLFTPHVGIGCLVGLKTRSVPVAFIVGFISHLVLDAIPHFDDIFPVFQTPWDIFLYPNWFWVDFLVAFVFGLVMMWRSGKAKWRVGWAMLASVLPDGLNYLAIFWGKGMISYYYYSIHGLLQINPGPVIGLLTQGLTLVFAWYFIYKHFVREST